MGVARYRQMIYVVAVILAVVLLAQYVYVAMRRFDAASAPSSPRTANFSLPELSSEVFTILYWGNFYQRWDWNWITPSSVETVECSNYVKCSPNSVLHSHGHWSWTWEPQTAGCTPNLKCKITKDREQFKNSKAVVFHPRSKHKQQPPSELRSPDQLYIYYNLEPPYWAGSSYPGHIFNWTMTYLQSSDVYYPYARVLPGLFKGGFKPLKNYLEGKTISALALVSNCRTKGRIRIIKDLSTFIDVMQLGLCSRKKEFYSKEALSSYYSKSKFFLSFENSNCNDYVTEKFYVTGLQHGMVPVVLAGGDLSSSVMAPPGSFIDASRFHSIEELADFLKQEGSSPAHYNKYFEWHSNFTIVQQEVSCTICEALHRYNKTSAVPVMYRNAHKWFKESNRCSRYWTFPGKTSNDRRIVCTFREWTYLLLLTHTIVFVR